MAKVVLMVGALLGVALGLLLPAPTANGGHSHQIVPGVARR